MQYYLEYCQPSARVLGNPRDGTWNLKILTGGPKSYNGWGYF